MSPPVPLDQAAPLSPAPFRAGIFWEQHWGGMQAPGVGTGADIPGPGLKNVDIVSAPNSSAGVHSPCTPGEGDAGIRAGLGPRWQGCHNLGADTLPHHLRALKGSPDTGHVLPGRLGHRLSLFWWPRGLCPSICRYVSLFLEKLGEHEVHWMLPGELFSMQQAVLNLEQGKSVLGGLAAGMLRPGSEAGTTV